MIGRPINETSFWNRFRPARLAGTFDRREFATGAQRHTEHARSSQHPQQALKAHVMRLLQIGDQGFQVRAKGAPSFQPRWQAAHLTQLTRRAAHFMLLGLDHYRLQDGSSVTCRRTPCSGVMFCRFAPHSRQFVTRASMMASGCATSGRSALAWPG